MNGDIYCDQWCPLDDNDGDLFSNNNDHDMMSQISYKEPSRLSWLSPIGVS